MQIQTRVSHLKAMLQFAGVKDVRYYLNGVCVEANAKHTRLIATNGHMLAILQSDTENTMPTDEPSVSLIIPSDAIKANKPAKGQDRLILERRFGQWQMHYGSTGVTFQPIDGRFPDYMRVLPRTEEHRHEIAQFNPEYVMAFQKANDILCHGAKSTPIPTIRHAGPATAIVRFPGNENFIGLLMPVREEEPSGILPDWINTPVLTAPEKQAA